MWGRLYINGRYPRRPTNSAERCNPHEALKRGHTGHGVAVRPRLTIVCCIMADSPISSFPIANLLLALGARPGKHKNTWHSPFREDKEASLHIDPDRNIWFDHGAGFGGGNIDLVMKCRFCTAHEAAEYILSLPVSEKMLYPSSEGDGPGKQKPKADRVLLVRELQCRYLLDYVASRGIQTNLASRYCKEVVIRGRSLRKTYDVLGFPNNAGGYALKSPTGFKSTTKSGITTIDTMGEFSDKVTSVAVTVFEGVFDFLSWLASERSVAPSTDVVVLNSVANVRRAFPYMCLHRTIYCCLDNDDAGRAALETIKSLCKDINDSKVIDGSLFYEGYNDVNDWWVAMKAARNGKP